MATTPLAVLTVVDEGLGHSSHVVGLGDGTALIVDPARFPIRQRRLASERGWEIAWSADTHSHADYISGSPDLSAEGATFVAPTRAALEHPHRGVEPGEEIHIARRLVLRAIPTPGHTPEHLAYLLLDDGVPVALFSGGSLMVGTVGRTDLVGDDQREELAVQLFRALRDEILVLPDDLPVYPTHGAGSFCAAPASSDRTTTIGRERATNPLLQAAGEREFVDLLVADFGSFPRYFRELPERNRRGVARLAEIPALPRLAVDEAVAEIERGAVLIDVRPIADFAAGHPGGALSIALRPVFASWVGWLVDLDRPLIFALGDAQERAELVRQCLTVGHEHLLGEIDGGVAAWAGAGLPVDTLPLVAPSAVGPAVLDVRQDAEYEAGHIPRALHVELGALSETEVAAGAGPLTLVCGHGERAMTGASLLAARGRRDITVLGGGPGDWAAWAGQDLVTGP